MLTLINRLEENNWAVVTTANAVLEHTMSKARISLLCVGRNSINDLVFNAIVYHSGSIYRHQGTMSDIVSAAYPYTLTQDNGFACIPR